MLIRADARRLPLVDGCVQCVVTSPPYWGLRDYGSPDQIGLERTPAAYVDSLREVFAEVWRVLKDDGTVWLNLGDSYASTGGERAYDSYDGATGRGPGTRRYQPDQALKPKDLVGIPWRVAFALQSDGWYLRSDIIWSKPNPMPESVTSRPTKAHEYLFLLAKSERYRYDADAIKELGAGRTDFGDTNFGARLNSGAPWPGGKKDEHARRRRGVCKATANGHPDNPGGGYGYDCLTRNKRSVWTVATMPYPGAHFATMPEKLVEPCILAGCPLGGLVLDPFIGSGTVGAVAERLGRRWVGTDLNYQDLASQRTSQKGLFRLLSGA